MLFSYLMFVVYLVIILCTLFICTSSPLYTHSLGHFLTTLDLHVQILDCNAPIPRYGDVTATYIRRSEIPLRIYAKHQYKQGSEYDKRSVHSYANMRSTKYKVITGCDILLHISCTLYHSQTQKYNLQYDYKMLMS